MNNLIFNNSYKNDKSTDAKKNKIDIKKFKQNTINSLNEVEVFLNDFLRLKKYINLYKIFKS